MTPHLPFKWLILALLVALWPVWRWYVAGTLDGSNDCWGLLAAATAMLLCWHARRASHYPHTLPTWPLLLPTLLLLAYLLATLASLSPALRAIPAALALAALASIGCFGRRIHLPLFGLCLLALPLAASLQFYLGYPLRVVAGCMSVALLQLNGLAVIREGTLLNFGGQLVSIDAPCSGVKMLWAAMYLCYTLAALRGLTPIRTVVAMTLSVCTVVLANAVRAAALFYTETGLIQLPPWTHAAIGSIVFAASAVTIIGIMQRLQGVPNSATTDETEFETKYETKKPGKDGSLQPEAILPTGHHWRNQSGMLASTRTAPWFWLLCTLAAALPLLLTQLAPASGKSVPNHAFPGWPTEFEGRPLRPLPLSALEQQFQKDFPGKIGRFSDGQREIILRWINNGSRRLHPAADCLKAHGYTLQTRPLRDQHGERWSRFLATHGRTQLLVSERITDGVGGQWSDTSAWYWATQLGSSRGPWWAITVAERVSGQD